MAVKKYTAEELISLMRLNGMLPDTASDGSQDADLLQHLNQAMLTELVPDLMKRHEEYFVTSRRFSVTSGRLRIPKRAVGQKLRDINWLDGSDRIDLRHLTREDLWLYDTSSGSTPWAFYIEGNHIVFVPDAASGTAEIAFCFRPGQLVLSTETRLVTSVDTSAGTITLASDPPATWDSSLLYDVHSPNSGAEIKVFDLVVTDIEANVLTVTAADINGSTHGSYAVEVGDYVCLAGEAALPALPLEMHPVLALAGLVRYLEAAGDQEQVQTHSAQLNRALDRAVTYTETRVDAHPKKIIRHHNFL